MSRKSMRPPKKEGVVYYDLLSERIGGLIRHVERDTCLYSSPQPILDHAAFKELVQIGEPAVLHLLRRLRTDPCWVTLRALSRIVGERGPTIPETDHGRFYNLCEHWIEWGRATGYL